MDGRDARRKLRGAVDTQDAQLLLAILRDPWPDHSLQLIGDGLRAALRAGASEAVQPAGRCVAELRERRWDGDRELAAALESELGTGGRIDLRELPVDLDELAAILEGDPVQGGGRINLVTGEVWPQPALDYAEEMGELDDESHEDDETDRWLEVDPQGSRDAYRDMEWFIDHLDDAAFADRLARAIAGRGAFRRFRDTLHRREELVNTWLTFSDDRHRGRARQWLSIEGYTPVPRPPTARPGSAT